MKKKLLLTAMCFLTANNYMAETKKDIRSVLHSPETLRSLVKRSEEINQFLATKKQVEEESDESGEDFEYYDEEDEDTAGKTKGTTTTTASG